ncbi:MAG TPA: hypothetical protein VN033_00555 [Vulgatibacter sp.]|nr:hypothetical protein [Vulgatibacter sp.]
MRLRLAAAIAALLAAACAEQELAPFGNLDTPVSLAVHEPSGHLFIALQGTNDLRVFATRSDDFLTGPAELFPLSIPTVRTPIAVAAARRFAFVVSGASAEIGFVDTRVPPGAFGPRSVDGPDGFPLTLAVDQVPTAVAALTAAFGFAEEGELGDHLVVAGLSPDGDGGKLTVVRPPHVMAGSTEALPSVAAEVLLPGAFPSDVAVDAGRADPEGDVADCRLVAVADANPDTGGVILARMRVEPDGSASLEPPSAADRVELEVPVTLPDGSVVTRRAGARALAFGPAPDVPGIEAALAEDPCAPRAGRLFVVLDPAYCGDALTCPNLAVLELDGAPALAVDATTGGPAAYRVPGAALGLVALEGPLRLPNAFDPSRIEDGVAADASPVPALTLVTSSDGAVTYLAGGLGPYLRADGSRASPDPVFLVSTSQTGPSASEPTRTDVRRSPAQVQPPVVEVPPDARPRSETWTAGFETPLAGFEGVGTVASLRGDTLRGPADSSRTFLSPLPILAASDPLLADRVVPASPEAGVICDGFPVVSVAADGRSLEVDRRAPGFDNAPSCELGDNPIAILPPKGLPWTLTGSSTGFVGRVGADPVGVFAGGTLLFRFQAPAGDVPRGATFGWQTTQGFGFYRANPDVMGLMPASIASVLAAGTPGVDPSWRVFVAYSGADAVMRLNPQAPDPKDLTFLQ